MSDLRGEAGAASTETLLDQSRTVVAAVRDALAHPRCQLPWEPDYVGRVMSPAALSHECVCLEQLDRGVRDLDPSSMITLVVRHHLETWLTGMYLLLGGNEAVDKFVGATRRSDEAQRNAIQKLQAEGGLDGYEVGPLENDDWEPARWDYEQVAREVDRLGLELQLLNGTRAAYAVGYRTFSGRLGAHPTWRLFDGYLDSVTGVARVVPAERTPIFRRAGLQWSVFMTAGHAAFALGERGLDTVPFGRVIESLRDPMAETPHDP